LHLSTDRQKNKSLSIFSDVELFKDLDKSGFADLGIIGYERDTEVSRRRRNHAVVQFRDIIDVSGCFQDFQAQRFTLVVFTFYEFFRLYESILILLFSKR